MPPPRLDLHGFSHSDVSILLDQFIYKHIGYIDVMHVITGNSPKMKEVVLECLRHYPVKRIENGDIFNKGYIRFWLS